MENKKWLVDCDCLSPGHFLVLEYEEDFGPTLSIQADYSWMSLWKRIKFAFNFIFKRDECQAQWSQVMVTKPKEMQKFKEWAEMYENSAHNLPHLKP